MAEEPRDLFAGSMTGIPGPVTLFGLLERRPDLTMPQFRTHWRTLHAAEALKLRPLYLAYLQNHRLDIPVPGFRRAFDGSPQLWFADAAILPQLGTGEAYITGAYLDEPQFMDGRSLGVAMHSTVCIPGPPILPDTPGVKVLLLLKAFPGLGTAGLRTAVADHPDPVVELSTPPVRHVRSFTLPGVPPLYDMAEELWWPDEAAFAAAWGEGALDPAIAAAFDKPGSAACLVHEHRVVWPDGGVTL